MLPKLINSLKTVGANVQRARRVADHLSSWHLPLTVVQAGMFAEAAKLLPDLHELIGVVGAQLAAISADLDVGQAFSLADRYLHVSSASGGLLQFNEITWHYPLMIKLAHLLEDGNVPEAWQLYAVERALIPPGSAKQVFPSQVFFTRGDGAVVHVTQNLKFKAPKVLSTEDLLVRKLDLPVLTVDPCDLILGSSGVSYCPLPVPSLYLASRKLALLDVIDQLQRQAKNPAPRSFLEGEMLKKVKGEPTLVNIDGEQLKEMHYAYTNRTAALKTHAKSLKGLVTPVISATALADLQPVETTLDELRGLLA